MAVVLIVNDHPGIASGLVLMVRGLGHDAVAAHDGPRALAVLGSLPVDLMVLDCDVPGCRSGLDVLRAVRSGAGGCPGLPVIMFTADEDARDEAVGLGVAAFVRKSRVETLCAEIAAHAGQPRPPKREGGLHPVE